MTRLWQAFMMWRIERLAVRRLQDWTLIQRLSAGRN